jgi:hypothetical protein
MTMFLASYFLLLNFTSLIKHKTSLRGMFNCSDLLDFRCSEDFLCRWSYSNKIGSGISLPLSVEILDFPLSYVLNNEYVAFKDVGDHSTLPPTGEPSYLRRQPHKAVPEHLV